MPWFKVDDSFYDHTKVFDAPDSAVALWIRAGCWSARNLKDGFVPTRMPARLCDDPDTAVRELLDRGLWKRVKGGYEFHDWTHYQPSATKVRDIRAKRAEAGRRGGQAKAAKHTPSNLLEPSQEFDKQNPAPSRPEGSVHVVSHPQQRNVRGSDDDDLISAVTRAVVDATECVPTEAEARALAEKVLARAGRNGVTVQNPARYVSAAIVAEPGLYAEVVAELAPPPDHPQMRSLVPWCRKCDERTRMRENDQGQPYRCPDCHPNAQEAS